MKNYVKNLQDEMICGFYVTSLRKQLWNVELGIYEYFKTVCQKYGLKHFLIGGSALGAIRHKGFIPWDDDIDIGMMRNDFDKLQEIVDMEFQSPYSVTYGVLENGISPLLRIRDCNTTGIIRGEELTNHNKGAFIEIYVYDNIPDEEKERKKQLEAVEQLTYLANFRIQKRRIRGKDDVFSYIKSHLKKPSCIWEEVIKECKRYNEVKMDYANTVSIPFYGKETGNVMRVAWADDIVEVPFENTKVCVLKENAKYLKQVYGDYMQLPPVEERGMHHDRIVFYDPTKSYTEYCKSDLVADYFSGTYRGDKL